MPLDEDIQGLADLLTAMVLREFKSDSGRCMTTPDTELDEQVDPAHEAVSE